MPGYPFITIRLYKALHGQSVHNKRRYPFKQRLNTQ
nr:MAG TPA: hypothetical protein [Caudoviricetes sp.]